MEIVFNVRGNLRQAEAVRAWCDLIVTDIVYGGSKGSGKSWLGASLIFGDAFLYPDTFYFIGRQTLNDLRKWTIPTIMKVFASWGVDERYYKYNGQDNYFELHNKSRIYLIELSEIPSDPDFARFGSREFTRGWIEEAGEVAEKAVQNISASIGRHNNDIYNLPGKLLQTCNPAKNYLYRNYYLPFKSGTLPPYKKFIQALPTDNKTLPAAYLENLNRIFSYNQKQRLLFGNWEYDDDPAVMISWEAITDAFTNEILPTGIKRISADLAMKGRDRFVAGLWDGLICNIVLDKLKSTGKEIETDLRNLIRNNNVGHSQVIVDSDGMGAYLESYLIGIKEFHGAGSAIHNNEYLKIKDECAYKLAELIEKRQLKIICTPEQRVHIEAQLSALKADDIDADTKKKKIVSKDEMKAQLGCSPDYLDMLLMGMWFHCKLPDVECSVYRDI